MRYLHTMIRVRDLDESLAFYCGGLGLVEMSRSENREGRFSLVMLCAPGDVGGSVVSTDLQGSVPMVEITYNWDREDYGGARNFGHLAYGVDDIYAVCQRLTERGVVINRPPRDGRMAFLRSPDNISIELLQLGSALKPAEPWMSMPNVGVW